MTVNMGTLGTGDSPYESDPLIDENDPRLTVRDIRDHAGKNDRPSDDKGRPDVRYMGMEEKLNEVLLTMRETHDLVTAFFEHASKHPMLGMVMKGLNK